MKKNIFRRASFEGSLESYSELTPFFKNYFGVKFHHFVVEHIIAGRCVNRFEFHPWEYKFNLFATLKVARQCCMGKKVNHVKTRNY